MRKLRALIAHEDTNMDGGAHCTNYDQAKKALEQGRDLIVKFEHYDGQNYHYGQYHVTNLRMLDDGNIVGCTENFDPDMVYLKGDYDWTATKELCEYAKAGRIS